MNKEQIQERYTEYQYLVQQLQQLQQNMSAFEKHVLELNSLNDNLGSLKNVGLNSETLMPFGNGIFVKAELKDNQNVVMNVGNNVCVDKTVDEARSLVDKQLEEVKSVVEQLQTEIGNTMTRLHELQHEIQHLKAE